MDFCIVTGQVLNSYDDRRYNLEAAQALGMDAILFNSRNVPYDGKTVKDFGELADMLTGH